MEKISIAGGKMHVMTRISADKLKGGKLGPNSHFRVVVGNVGHCQPIHTSCSKPLGVGMIFGKYLITCLVNTQKK